MQMFGVGILELLVILVITAIIVGPERMPQVAADLARWIRRARAHGQHPTRGLTDGVSELEGGAGGGHAGGGKRGPPRPTVAPWETPRPKAPPAAGEAARAAAEGTPANAGEEEP